MNTHGFAAFGFSVRAALSDSPHRASGRCRRGRRCALCDCRRAAPASAAGAAAQPKDDHSAATPPAATSDEQSNDDSSDSSDRDEWRNRIELRHRRNRHQDDNDLVSIGHSSHLQSGQKADSVVSVFGSSTSEGEAVDVVSVFGNTRVTGPVSDGAVAVLGNVYVDSKVDGDVVAVLGNVRARAQCRSRRRRGRGHGRGAARSGRGRSRLGTKDHRFGHRRVSRASWAEFLDQALLALGRPLAFAPGLGWAWTLALCLLAFYACLALMFREGIDQCVQTLESQPGHTALAALLGILLTPVLLILLCVTVIGIAAVPFVVAASVLHVAVRQGRHAGMAGRPHFGPQAWPRRPSRVAVLIGGAVVLILYVVPIVGFLVYKLLGFFGFGAVLYTLVLRRARAPPPVNGRHSRAPVRDDRGRARMDRAAAAAAGTAASPAGGAARRRDRAPGCGTCRGARRAAASRATISPRPCRVRVFGYAWAALLLDIYWWASRRACLRTHLAIFTSWCWPFTAR